jgi:hypothetical protein
LCDGGDHRFLVCEIVRHCPRRTAGALRHLAQ